jgi:hypothetical protein
MADDLENTIILARFKAILWRTPISSGASKGVRCKI